ncbi:MAG: DUF4190 domain-containing protein [Bacteroidota bacterium]
MTIPQTTTGQLERGRGALILVLGILSLVMFGLITGIPAWVMGHTDLRRMREGKMENTEEGLTRAGMILGIIGTLLSGLIIVFMILVVIGIFSFAGMMIFGGAALDAQEQAIEAHLYSLARNAQIYRVDQGTYEGYEIPPDLRRTKNEVYTAQISEDQIVFRGRATNRRGSISATLDSDGNLIDWVYEGEFDEESFDRESIRQQTRHGLNEFTYRLVCIG